MTHSTQVVFKISWDTNFIMFNITCFQLSAIGMKIETVEAVLNMCYMLWSLMLGPVWKGSWKKKKLAAFHIEILIENHGQICILAIFLKMS